MTDARVAFPETATARALVGTGDGETVRAAAAGSAGADAIGVATGDGAPDAAVAKQIVRASALRARRYRIIG